MADKMDELFTEACAKIDDEKTSLNELSQAIWSNPELCFEEKKCHGILTEFLEKRGFHVVRNYVLNTAFRATWGPGLPDADSGLPHVMVLCEYDALPDIGHACGHNLIAEVGVAAGLGVKAAMEKHGGQLGKLTILGSPAEEGGGGKCYLIESGCMKGVDVAMMAHPCPFNNATPIMLSVKTLDVNFKGRASHASAFPWEGINALDAAVHAYTGISHLRQQIRPQARIHGIITKGGSKANVIPDLCSMEYILREETEEDLEVICNKAEGVFKAAALATGCTVELKWGRAAYQNMVNNQPLASSYERHISHLQPDWEERRGGEELKGSTDMGNISHVTPSIHPMYYIGSEVNHTKPFTAVAGSEAAQEPTVNQGKALAMTCIEVMMDGDLMRKVKDEFKQQKGISRV